MDDCREMSVPVHYHIPGVSRHQQKQFVERIAGSTVLTLSNNYATPLQLFSKRAMDLIGGLVGSLFALLVIAIIGPIIKHASPGPILYKSERIGQNGKRYISNTFRSMRNGQIHALYGQKTNQIRTMHSFRQLTFSGISFSDRLSFDLVFC